MGLAPFLYRLFRRVAPYRHTERPNRALLLFEDLLRGRLLEVGCQRGRLSRHARSFATRLVGLDLDEGALRDLRKEGLLAVRADADGRWLPFADETFDTVICSHLLEHLAHPEETVEELVRVLRPGGVALVAVPNPRCFYYDFFRPGNPHGHVRSWTKEEMERELRRAGLCLERFASNYPFFWNRHWGRLLNSIPLLRSRLSDLWFAARKPGRGSPPAPVRSGQTSSTRCGTRRRIPRDAPSPA